MSLALLDLPEDIVLAILLNLPAKDILSVGQVNLSRKPGFISLFTVKLTLTRRVVVASTRLLQENGSGTR